MPASWATSARRRPGVRRRPATGRPTSAGRTRSLLERRNSANARWSIHSSVPDFGPCRGPQGGPAGTSLAVAGHGRPLVYDPDRGASWANKTDEPDGKGDEAS